MKNIKIGVVIADNEEYASFADMLSDEFCISVNNWLSRAGIKFSYNTTEIICVHSGIGKVNAAAAATYLICNGCNMILNFGFSGGISSVRRGDIVIPEKFLEHDFDLSTIGYKQCEKPNQRYIYEADSRLLDVFKKLLPYAASGTAVCGDRFICSDAERSFLRDTFDAVSCDMETAAIAAVCDIANIPFAALRCVSDDAGDDAIDSYRDMNTTDRTTLPEHFLKCIEAVSGLEN